MAEFRADGGRRTPRRRWIVGVVAASLAGAMALGAGLAFGPATPASANVNQVYSTDEDGAGGVDYYLSTDAHLRHGRH